MRRVTGDQRDGGPMKRGTIDMVFNKNAMSTIRGMLSPAGSNIDKMPAVMYIVVGFLHLELFWRSSFIILFVSHRFDLHIACCSTPNFLHHPSLSLQLYMDYYTRYQMYPVWHSVSALRNVNKWLHTSKISYKIIIFCLKAWIIDSSQMIKIRVKSSQIGQWLESKSSQTG